LIDDVSRGCRLSTRRKQGILQGALMPGLKSFPRAIRVMTENTLGFIESFTLRYAFRICFNHDLNPFLRYILFLLPYLWSKDVSTKSGNEERVSVGGSYHTKTNKGYLGDRWSVPFHTLSFFFELSQRLALLACAQ